MIEILLLIDGWSKVITVHYEFYRSGVIKAEMPQRRNLFYVNSGTKVEEKVADLFVFINSGKTSKQGLPIFEAEI
jgi:hypothetical protein